MDAPIGPQQDRTGVAGSASDVGAMRRLTGRSVFWITLVNILIVVVFGTLSTDHVFVSVGNARNVLLDASGIVVLSIGEAMLLGAALLDISIGANVVLSSVVGAKVMVATSGTYAQVSSGQYPHLALGIALGILTCIGIGSLFGLVNGLLVGWLGINALVTTLGTLGIGTGIAYVLTNGLNVSYIPPGFQTGFGSKIFASVIPAPALVVMVLCLAVWLLVVKTRFGLHLLAIGSSRPTAIRVGLRVRKDVIVLFVLMGALAGFAGVVDIARFATTDVSGHTSDALSAIAGAVIGGTSLFGGEVSIGGAVMGSVLTVLLSVGLVIMNLPSFYQMIAVGVVLIVAVAVDDRRRSRRDAGIK